MIPPEIFSPGFNGYRDWGLHPPTIQSRYVSRCSGAGRAICKMSICQSESPPWWHSSGCSRGIHGDPSDERICHRSQVCDEYRHLIIIIVSVIIVVSSGVDIGQGRAGNLFCLFMTSESEVDCCPSMLESKLQRLTNTDWMLLLMNWIHLRTDQNN